MPKVIQVIESDVYRGKEDLGRRVMQYFDLDGGFLAERDEFSEEKSQEDYERLAADVKQMHADNAKLAAKLAEVAAERDRLKDQPLPSPKYIGRALFSQIEELQRENNDLRQLRLKHEVEIDNWRKICDRKDEEIATLTKLVNAFSVPKLETPITAEDDIARMRRLAIPASAEGAADGR